MGVQILIGDVRDRLKDIPDESVHCVVTSPPYFGLRDYGTAQWEGGEAECDHLGEPFRTKASININCGTGTDRKNAEGRQPFGAECGKCGARRIDSQIGLEPTPDAFVATMVEVFREVRRVLRKDGTCWINLGDSYAANRTYQVPQSKHQSHDYGGSNATQVPPGLKPKDLIGIPWRVAFALQADGWWLRQDIIWHKPNPMPESVRDRCTKAHEYVFLLTRSERYFYDIEAVREAAKENGGVINGAPLRGAHVVTDGGRKTERRVYDEIKGANRRSVWTIATQPFSEAHFATFPPELPELCIKAGTSEKGCCPHCGNGWVRDVEKLEPEGRRDSGGVVGMADAGMYSGRAGSRTAKTIGWSPSCECKPWGFNEPVPCTVLDPFGGAGTTALVADRLGRNAILIELNPEYAAMAQRRIQGDAGLFASVAAE